MPVLIRLLLSALLALLLACVVGMLSPGAFDASALPHPDYPPLLQSTGPKAPYALGVVFGVLVFGVMGLTLLLGFSRSGRLGPAGRWMLLGLALYLGTFLAVAWTYPPYLQAADPAFFAGFPVPTAWMVLGVGLTPLVLIGVMIRYFDTWYYPKASQERFDALLAVRDVEEP